MSNLSLPLGQLVLNDNNPRLIKDERFAQLVQSLIDFPEMLTARPAVVDENLLILGGNMRTRAKSFLLELPEVEAAQRIERAVVHRREQHEAEGGEYDEASHRELLRRLFFVDEVLVTQMRGLLEYQKREFIIKDNAGFGEWDWEALANGEWGEPEQLNNWGVELPIKWGEDSPDELPEKELSAPIETEHTCPNCGHEF